MKIKALRDIELGDLTADFDLDGTFAIVKLSKDQVLDLSTLDLSEVKKSLKRGALKKAIEKSWIEKVTPTSGSDIAVDEMANVTKDLVNWVISNDVAVQFLPVNGVGTDNAISGAINTDVSVELAVTDGDGTVDILNSSATVDISITGGTATTKQIRTVGGTYGAGPITVSAVNGKASFEVKGSVGTITLGLSGGNTSLNLNDTATVTLA